MTGAGRRGGGRAAIPQAQRTAWTAAASAARNCSERRRDISLGQAAGKSGEEVNIGHAQQLHASLEVAIEDNLHLPHREALSVRERGVRLLLLLLLLLLLRLRLRLCLCLRLRLRLRLRLLRGRRRRLRRLQLRWLRVRLLRWRGLRRRRQVGEHRC